MGVRNAVAGVLVMSALVAAAAAAVAAPAPGPRLDVSIGKPAGAQDAAVTDAGDAIVVFASFPACCVDDPPVFVRQRRGARGPFGPVVRAAAPGAPQGPRIGGPSSALGRSGDAYIVIPRSAGFQVLVRRGWTGSWRRVTAPDATPLSYSTSALSLSRAGRALDLVWLEDGPGGRVVRGARLEGSTWIAAPGIVLAGGATFSDIAVAPGGAAVATTVTSLGRIVATARSGFDAAWEPPVELARVAPPAFGAAGVNVRAAAGRDGSLIATWTGVLADGDRPHAFIARRRPGTPVWDPPVDLGAGAAAPAADTNATGRLAVAWPESDGGSDEGATPFLLRVGSSAASLGSPATITAAGSPRVRIDDDGRVVLAAFAGLNAANSTATLLYQWRADGPVRRAATIAGGSGAFAAGARSALLVGGSSRPAFVGIDQLGPVGLQAPARARAGRSVRVRLELWRRARITLRLLGGPARASVTRTLPPGRSTIVLRVPSRPGTYLVLAAGQEPGRTSVLRQEAAVRVR